MLTTWWLSFADPTKPKGSQHLGVVIIDITDLDLTKALIKEPPNLSDRPRIAAVEKAHRLDINPGGEVMTVKIDFNQIIPDQFKNRLLTKDEAIQLNQLFERGLSN